MSEIDSLPKLEIEVISRIKKSGKTYADLDRESGVSRSSIRNYVLSGRVDSTVNLFKLVEYFGISYTFKS